MYPIEHGIPIPNPRAPYTKRNSRGANAKYDWLNMDVGDSFFVPDILQMDISSAAHMAGQRFGMRFSTRQFKNGVRVWRVE